MRRASLLVAMLTALPFLPSTGVAQSPLTTVFSSYQTGGVIESLYFDLTVTTPAITITGMDLNLIGTGSVQIYTRSGTRLGHQTNAAAWTLSRTATVTNAQPGGPTPLTFAPLSLGTGVTGVAVHCVGSLDHIVTHATATPATVATAEVTLAAGEVSTAPFGGAMVGNWVVNTSIRYLVGDLVGLPPHNNAYNFQSRGFNFTASTDFIIRQLALPPEAKQPGDTASYLVRKNGVVAFRSIGNAGAVTPGLAIQTGDVVDVIGNWSAASVGANTAHNSYATVPAPYATTIQGVAHTLNRCGWHWDIGDPNWTPNGSTGTYLAPVSGQFGRILMTTEPPVGASNTVLGTGCGQQHASIYELLSPASFDLANRVINMNPTNHGFTVNTIGGLLPVGSVGTPVTLGLGDDAEVTVPFTVGSFLDWTGVTVCSNGIVSKATGNSTTWAVSVALMLNSPQTAVWAWHDYNPQAPGSGQIKFEESPQLTVITWDGVYTYGDPTPTTMQIQLHFGGQIVIAFGSVSANGTRPHLVGYSPGGPNTDPGPFDFTSLLPFYETSTNSPDAPALALSALTRPIAGATWNLQLANVPPSTVFGVDILGVSDPGILDLAAIGMPGCQLRASLDSLMVWAHGSGTTHNYAWQVPSLALLGASVYTASATFSNQPVNTFGAVISNGIRGTIGSH
jgi:hypothetical protein